MTEAAERDEGLSAGEYLTEDTLSRLEGLSALGLNPLHDVGFARGQFKALIAAARRSARPSEHREPEGGQIYRELWTQMQEIAKANGFDGCTDAIVRAQKAEAKLAEHREPGAGELREALERIRDGKLKVLVGSGGNQVGEPFHVHLDPEEAAEIARKALEGSAVKKGDPGILKGCWEAVNMAAETCAHEATKAATKRAAVSLRLVASECGFARDRIERLRPDLQRTGGAK